MPLGPMMGAATAGQNSDRRGHTPAGYLTNATNTTEIIGHPVKVAPAILGRRVDIAPDPLSSDSGSGSAPAIGAVSTSASPAGDGPAPGRTLGRNYTGAGTGTAAGASTGAGTGTGAAAAAGTVAGIQRR